MSSEELKHEISLAERDYYKEFHLQRRTAKLPYHSVCKDALNIALSRLATLQSLQRKYYKNI